MDTSGALRAAVRLAELLGETREVEERVPMGWGASWSVRGWAVS
jgi:hypothetical protein